MLSVRGAPGSYLDGEEGICVVAVPCRCHVVQVTCCLESKKEEIQLVCPQKHKKNVVEL